MRPRIGSCGHRELLSSLANLAIRERRARRAQAWPPVIAKRKGWDEMYAALAEGLPVLQDVDEAIRWANEFVARIDGAR